MAALVGLVGLSTWWAWRALDDGSSAGHGAARPPTLTAALTLPDDLKSAPRSDGGRTQPRDPGVLRKLDPEAPGVVAKESPPPAVRPQPADPPPSAAAEAPPSSAGTEIEAARRLVAEGRWLDARAALCALHERRLPADEAATVRALLTRVADATIFASTGPKDDPLIEQYTVRSGDVLQKIARQFAVNHELIMHINGITDVGRLRAGQRLRIPRGPFHARVHRSLFRMDVYLQDVFVRSYRVGLGANDGTPLGVWKVTLRQKNPTYYPSESAPDKRVIAGGDPANPLGGWWIALEGVEGDAVGQRGFGIHGTNEPDSIGQAASLGCIRMRDEEAADVHALLTPGRSRVTILP
jgi:LysM repeat protein